MATIAEAFALAVRYQQTGYFLQAEELCRQILQAASGHAESHHLLGVLAYQNGRFDQARSCIRQAIALQPAIAAYHFNLGLANQALGNLEEALAQFQEAVRLKPDFVEAHTNLANAYLGQGQPEEAVAHYRQALTLRPDYADAHCGLGVALAAQAQLDEAVTQFRHALRLSPDFVGALYNLANALERQGNLEEAVTHWQHALRLKPDFADAHNNLGNALAGLGRPDEAVAHLRQAVQIRPDYADAHRNLGATLQSQGKLQQAMASFQDALRCNPADAEAHKGLALLQLLHGDFERGWLEFQWHWAETGFAHRHAQQPLWDGSELHGKTILLGAEHGLGDTIHFIRYVPLVKERGGRVVVECQAALLPLLAGVKGIDCLLTQGSSPPAFDAQAPLLSLPGIFRTALNAVPATVPFLHADSELVERWRRKLEQLKGFRVGIAWQGNPTYQYDRQRSIPLAQFAPLAKVPGVRLISLQKGPGADQLQSAAKKKGSGTVVRSTLRAVPATVPDPFFLCPLDVLDLGSDLDEASGAFMDTAAIVKNLDLVICSDSAVAHLAGALAVPVWVALALVPDWRWLLEREDSPWYPTMRLYRQRHLGQWEDVFERIAADLTTAAQIIA